MIQKESEFSRTQYNLAKAGAYYTDAGHTARIGRMFQFPKEVCALEPCIGDATAVKALLKNVVAGEEPVHLFGVEINPETYRKTQEAEGVDYHLNADFLTGIRVTNKAFSFCFANPPYMATGEAHEERVEQKFVERIFNYLKPNGYLVLVVSYSTLCIERFAKSLLARFECLGIWKFDDAEYKKYKQLAVILKRKETARLMTKEMAVIEKLNLEELPYLPSLDEPIETCFEVPPSYCQNIDLFMKSEFNADEAILALSASPLYQLLDKHLLTKAYSGLDIGQPVLPLRKDFYYICAVTGGGQGLVGSDKNQDMHLQRGCARRVENLEIQYSGDREEASSVRAHYSTEVTVQIIENDGKITRY